MTRQKKRVDWSTVKRLKASRAGDIFAHATHPKGWLKASWHQINSRPEGCEADEKTAVANHIKEGEL